MEPLNFPDWFRKVPGFTYADSDGDLCIYLGYISHPIFKSIGVLNIDGTEEAQKFSEILFKCESPVAAQTFMCLFEKKWCYIQYTEGDLEYIQQLPEGHDLSHISAGEIPKYGSAKLPEKKEDRSLWTKGV